MHTPGPWFLELPGDNSNCNIAWVWDGDWRVQLEERPRIVTDVLVHEASNRIPDSEQVANARLIAAAPELLEAAHGVDILYAELQSALPGIVNTPAWDIVQEAVRQARAAIARATEVPHAD